MREQQQQQQVLDRQVGWPNFKKLVRKTKNHSVSGTFPSDLISTDVGPDNKNTLTSTKAEFLSMVIMLDLASVVAFQNTSD